jgi:hypothetical protein
MRHGVPGVAVKEFLRGNFSQIGELREGVNVETSANTILLTRAFGDTGSV